MIYRFSYMSGGAGFLPSTVALFDAINCCLSVPRRRQTFLMGDALQVSMVGFARFMKGKVISPIIPSS